ncbi:uncharacterized protein LOC142340921 [Convolutriloba macropyga]|uniref:uncharacterized protein LOC142340921 n=1 Tax=Convolutriloba macropyga TaxID=536237 RepID=UPI003F520508
MDGAADKTSSWRKMFRELLLSDDFSSDAIFECGIGLDVRGLGNELIVCFDDVENSLIFRNALQLSIDCLSNQLLSEKFLDYLETRNQFIESCLSKSVPSGSIEVITNCLWFLSGLTFFKPALVARNLNLLFETLLLISLNGVFFDNSNKQNIGFLQSFSSLLQKIYFLFPSYCLNSMKDIVKTVAETKGDLQLTFLQSVFANLPVGAYVFSHSAAVGDELCSFQNPEDIFNSQLKDNSQHRGSQNGTGDQKFVCPFCQVRDLETSAPVTSFESLITPMQNGERIDSKLKAELMLERSTSHLLKSKLSSSRKKIEESTTKLRNLELQVENLKGRLEKQENENKRLMKTLQDLDSKNGDLKLKIDEISEDLFLSKESSTANEKQLIRIKEELTSEKKKNTTLSAENAQIKAKIFEYSEIRNKLTRKVDAQALIENQLQTLTKELFFMSEVHHKYEEKITKMQLEQRSANEDQITIISYRRELSDLRQRNISLESKVGILEQKLLQQENDAAVYSECKTEESKAMLEQIKIFETTLQEYQQEITRLRLLLEDKNVELRTKTLDMEACRLRDVRNTREKCVGTQ